LRKDGSLVESFVPRAVQERDRPLFNLPAQVGNERSFQP